MTALSGGALEQAPRWDLVDTESCGGGIRFLSSSLFVWGYVGIYRRKKYVGGLRGAHEAGVRTRGGAPTLVTASLVPWHRVQVSWITFGEKITFPKVSFCLDSVFIFFETLKHAKNSKSGLGLWLIG